MPTKTCSTCNLTLDVSNFYKSWKYKGKQYYQNKCKKFPNDSLKCEHGRRKADCHGSNRCEHGRIKGDCNGSRRCEHGKIRDRCPKCGGSSLCIHCKHIQGKQRYVKSLDKKVRCCARCFYHFYPSDQISRKFKMKQHYFNEKLIEEFGDIFQYDKVIKCGCSKRRPDLVY